MKTAYLVGILPRQLFDMELWEYNCCVHAAQERQKEKAQETITQAWMTANLASAAIAGKLKPLEHYVKTEKKAQQISYDEFDKMLAKAKEGGVQNGT